MTETKLVKASETGIAVPAYVRTGDTRGTEHIHREDLQMPRIGLAQGLSPQLMHGDPNYIEGLSIGQMFNNLTHENYGRGPIEFVVVRADIPRGIEFFPLDQGGGIKDFNVPLNDPRMLFGANGEKPIATRFYDFIIMLLPSQELIALSFKSTGIKVAKQLNALIKLRNAPLFAGKYKLSSVMTKNKAGTFAIFQVANAGFVDELTCHRAEAIYETLKDKEITFEREPGDETGVVRADRNVGDACQVFNDGLFCSGRGYLDDISFIKRRVAVDDSSVVDQRVAISLAVHGQIIGAVQVFDDGGANQIAIRIVLTNSAPKDGIEIATPVSQPLDALRYIRG